MLKSKKTALISSTITLAGSLHKRSSPSQSRLSIPRVTSLTLHRRPIIELVKTPGRRKHPQTKGKFAVPSSSRLRSVLTASIEVRMTNTILVKTHFALRNQKRKTIRLCRQMPSHKLSSTPGTKRTLSRVRYRQAHNSLSPRPPMYDCLRLLKSPLRRNKWLNHPRNLNRQSNRPPYHIPMFDHSLLNQNYVKKISLSRISRTGRPFLLQIHL